MKKEEKSRVCLVAEPGIMWDSFTSLAEEDLKDLVSVGIPMKFL